jgi:hypothetical protein
MESSRIEAYQLKNPQFRKALGDIKRAKHEVDAVVESRELFVKNPVKSVINQHQSNIELVTESLSNLGRVVYSMSKGQSCWTLDIDPSLKISTDTPFVITLSKDANTPPVSFTMKWLSTNKVELSLSKEELVESKLGIMLKENIVGVANANKKFGEELGKLGFELCYIPYRYRDKKIMLFAQSVELKGEMKEKGTTKNTLLGEMLNQTFLEANELDFSGKKIKMIAEDGTTLIDIESLEKICSKLVEIKERKDLNNLENISVEKHHKVIEESYLDCLKQIEGADIQEQQYVQNIGLLVEAKQQEFKKKYEEEPKEIYEKTIAGLKSQVLLDKEKNKPRSQKAIESNSEELNQEILKLQQKYHDKANKINAKYDSEEKNKDNYLQKQIQKESEKLEKQLNAERPKYRELLSQVEAERKEKVGAEQARLSKIVQKTQEHFFNLVDSFRRYFGKTA